MSKPGRQAAFLIRVQENEDQTRWRAMVEDAYSGARMRFASKHDLMKFLLTVIHGGENPGVSGPAADAEPSDS